MSALLTTSLVTLLLASAAPRAPQWHRDDLPHAQPELAATRIVSFAPVVTETLFLLGRGDNVVGVTRFCDRPPQAAARDKVGGFVDISLERVVALKPDLVIAMPSLGQRALLDRLRGLGIPVLVVFADGFAEVKLMTSGLGDVVRARPAADALNADLDLAMAALRGKMLTPRRAAVVVGHAPLVVAGPGTFAAEALSIAGLSSAVPPDAPLWPVWSAESLALSGVQVLVAAEGAQAAAALRALIDRVVPAGRRPHVVAAAEPILMRPGPALVADLAALGALLAALEDPPHSKRAVVAGEPP